MEFHRKCRRKASKQEAHTHRSAVGALTIRMPDAWVVRAFAEAGSTLADAGVKR
jgi:hypothetical protein